MSSFLMIRPLGFRGNEETFLTNDFQKKGLALEPQEIQEKVLFEFEGLRNTLEKHGFSIFVFDSLKKERTPDAVFPNNWIASIQEKLVLFPMMAENRRQERRSAIVEFLSSETGYPVVDLSFLEKDSLFLEGTGSLVFERDFRKAYACLSGRTHREALSQFEKRFKIPVHSFRAVGDSSLPIYHTNVLMSLGKTTAVVCLEAVPDSKEREALEKELRKSHAILVEISRAQMKSFCGNILWAQNLAGKAFWILSERAFSSFEPDQKRSLEKEGEFLVQALETLEDLGGGGARCMLCEI